jgi:catechol 2,3-dioxygenase-like lactoylglutathione lyase family enzyme
LINGLNHITLATHDVARSFIFYTDMLGARPLARWDKGAYLLLADVWLCLSLDRDAPPPAANYTHIAFGVRDDNFAAMVEKLQNAGVIEWKTNTSEGASFYFLDPDGNRLELHDGDWKSRLAHYRQNPPPGMVFYPAADASTDIKPSRPQTPRSEN